MKKILFIFLLLSPLSAHAYVGPGLGVGAIGVILGVLLSLILAFFAILWYPFKRLYKKMKKKKSDSGDSK